ncbi:cordon-bleu protein-like 1 isoform X3 [Uloborus diversus]|uniref:cordon-bleu protein-like 1 isoform X3 n=1 Tax=Uloborus diversus TaxID=327109 RepID=UPI00240A45DA|nr:cordon-bleu protein-like 1 isoform X3 [Uloborus diversus]
MMGCACFKGSIATPNYVVNKYHSTRMKKVAPPPPAAVLGRSLSNGSAPLPTGPGEDCAIDERLEGRMDLELVLPDLRVVHMTVDRRTPMMDLLVQATTSNKIPPSDHIINVISKDERSVHYKPNTPIGSLDANTVYIVPKSTLEQPVKRMPKLANQPFEQQTFRLQVNLPHNQRMVLRVSPRITLAELKNQICSEKELDHSTHHLVHPAQPDTVLDLNATLEVYGCAEISLMSNSGLRDSIRSTSTNFFVYQGPRIEEEKKKKGILRLFSRKKKDIILETGTNGLHTLSSSQSESTGLNKLGSQSKHSIKRRPAPAPPRNSSPPLITQSSNSINSRPESEISVKTADEIESSVSHSRHSSDSSGYHEPSVFSDCSENKSPEASIVHGDHVSVSDANRQDSPLHKDYSDGCVLMKRSSMTSKETNLKNVPSCSNVSIISASRKRKAPQPPVSTLPAIESPSSPDMPPVEPPDAANQQHPAPESYDNESETSTRENGPIPPTDCNVVACENGDAMDSVRQESEAIQYLEEVLQESENCSKNYQSQKMLDDSDTDSQKDEREVISVCQAEIHAVASDQDSSDSVVEPHTVVTPEPVSPKSSFPLLTNPASQSAGCEVVDTSADDSGISHSLTSDADSSMPSINSDLKTMSDSGCQEEIYCNIAESADEKSVPSDVEFPAQSNSETTVSVNDSETSSALNNVDDMLPHAPVDCAAENTSAETVERRIKDQLVCNDETNSSSKNENIADKVPPETIVYNSVEIAYNNANSDKNSVSSSLSNNSPRDSASTTPQTRRKLENFALGCYKKEETVDIYSNPPAEVTAKSNSQLPEKTQIEAPPRKLRSHPEVKVSCVQEIGKPDAPELATSADIVEEKSAQPANTNTVPLAVRSLSLYNLIPRKYERPVIAKKYEEVPVPDNIKRTHSDQNFVQDSEAEELRNNFLQEQKRLQEEYHRLQAQFISWQKQLLCNQSLLQSEKIVPQMPFPPFGSLENLDTKSVTDENHISEDSSKIGPDGFRTRSLPRSKSKTFSLKEPARPSTPPVPETPSEASIVDIDISSHDGAKKTEAVSSCSVDTQANVNLEDKDVQVQMPEDKTVQVPSPQEKVTSSTQVPSPESAKSMEDVSAQTSDKLQSSPDVSPDESSVHSLESENSKSQTLPRPKPKPNSAFQPSHAMTLNRNTRPKSQVVSVTIGSWQQRQVPALDIEPSSVASSRSKFQSLENIPQGFSKVIPNSMEKRKLPPVPMEEKKCVKGVGVTNKPTELELNNETQPKLIKEHVSVKSKVNQVHLVKDHKNIPNKDEVPKSSHKTSDANVYKAHDMKQADIVQKQKFEIKVSAKEPSSMFKAAKPFVKMSSMKDESHTPSIIGLKKWPLAEISEVSDGRQSIIEDLRTSSKRPGGYVQEKIRRAEVDLRKPKSSKTESVSSSKKDTNVDSSKLHITKVNINNVKSNPDEYASVHKTKIPPSNTNISVKQAGSSSWSSNTIPKSHSLNSELMAVFSKKPSRFSSEKNNQYESKVTAKPQNITVQWF